MPETPKLRAPTDYERGMGVLSDWFEDVAKQPFLTTLQAIASIPDAIDRASRARIASGTNRQVLGEPMPLMDAATVFHGSPYRFTKFDMSKVGTGEGAQGYGHGLYFADSPGVAKSYQKFGDWANRAPVMLDGKPVAFNSVGNAEVGDSSLGAFLARVSAKGDPKIALSEAEGVLAEMKAQKIFPNEQIRLHNEIKAGRKNLHRITGHGDTGNLYSVDLPDEAIAKMLDWDAPLSQQPEAVRRLAAERGFVKETATGAKYDPAGQVVYEQAGFTPDRGMTTIGTRSPEAASALLRERGIPGIKYYDGMSRGAGQGTRNYVVFDDSLPQILTVNGVPLSQIGAVR